MADIYESYYTGDNSGWGLPVKEAATDKLGQTFTPSESHTITSVRLKLLRIGSPGTITVAIYATSEGYPTGDALCSGTRNGNTVTTSSSGSFYEITLGSGAVLSSGTKYVIILTAPEGTITTDIIKWRVDSIGATYSGGDAIQYPNMYLEDVWGTREGADFMFICYGSSLPEKPINPTPDDEASDVTLDGTTVTWENGGGATSYDVYYGTLSGFLDLLESGVTDTYYTLRDTNWPSYDQVWYWRIDAVNDSGTTTGDEWYFTTLVFAPPTPDGVTWDDPGNDDGYTGTPLGTNNMLTVRRMVGAAANCIWIET